MRIVCVDDDAAYCTRFAATLTAALTADVTRFTHDTFLSTPATRQYDLAFVDPFTDAVSDPAPMFVHAAATAVRVVVLSQAHEQQHLAAAISHRVDGYLVKSAGDADHMAHIAELLAAGRPAVTHMLAPTLFSLVTHRNRSARTSSLTARERAVLQRIAAGDSNRAIAHQLGIAENTVKNHVRHILAKLQVRSRLGAVVVAAQGGIVSIDTTEL